VEAKKTPALYQKRDGKWYCTLWGRQRYLGRNLEVAREKLKGLLAGKEEKKHAETVGEFAEAYLVSLQNNQSPDTIRTKAVTYRSFREFLARAAASAASWRRPSSGTSSAASPKASSGKRFARGSSTSPPSSSTP